MRKRRCLWGSFSIEISVFNWSKKSMRTVSYMLYAIATPFSKQLLFKFGYIQTINSKLWGIPNSLQRKLYFLNRAFVEKILIDSCLPSFLLAWAVGPCHLETSWTSLHLSVRDIFQLRFLYMQVTEASLLSSKTLLKAENTCIMTQCKGRGFSVIDWYTNKIQKKRNLHWSVADFMFTERWSEFSIVHSIQICVFCRLLLTFKV